MLLLLLLAAAALFVGIDTLTQLQQGSKKNTRVLACETCLFRLQQRRNSTLPMSSIKPAHIAWALAAHPPTHLRDALYALAAAPPLRAAGLPPLCQNPAATGQQQHAGKRKDREGLRKFGRLGLAERHRLS